MEIYLDNAATTKPITKAAVQRHMEQSWHNPSAVYRQAEAVFKEIKHVRQQLISAVHLQGSCVFTSGGTEANNLVLSSYGKRGSHMITSAIEHPSVYETCRYMEQSGVLIDYVKPQDFNINPDDVAALVTEDTALVSVMHVNNETGALNDIIAIGKAVKAKNPDTIVHADGVQALLKTNVDLSAGYIDCYTVSAHKIHALKGTGALLTRQEVSLKPLHLGGGQELSLRAGTENTLGIMAFGEALEEIARFGENNMQVERLREKFIEGVAKFDDCVVNTPKRFVPHIVSISFEGVRGEVLARVMGEKGICIGTGAACSRGKLSRVLLECNIGRAYAEGTVRVSFSALNTFEEVAVCLEQLKSAVTQLRRFARK